MPWSFFFTWKKKWENSRESNFLKNVLEVKEKEAAVKAKQNNGQAGEEECRPGDRPKINALKTVKKGTATGEQQQQHAKETRAYGQDRHTRRQTDPGDENIFGESQKMGTH